MAKPKKSSPPPDLFLGPLPVDAINRTLGHDLEPGMVVFTGAAQLHAFRRHQTEFQKCLPHVGGTVEKPDFLGDDFKNEGKIELVARVQALGGGLLVALVIEPDEQGQYLVASCYPVSQKKIEGRRENGFLIIPKWK